MALTIPTYQPRYSTTTISDAYAWIASLALDLGSSAGRVTFFVHPDAASANAGLAPIEVIGVGLGDVVVPASGQTPAVTFATLAQVVSSAAAIQAANPGLDPWGAFRMAIYQSSTSIPKFAGASIS